MVRFQYRAPVPDSGVPEKGRITDFYPALSEAGNKLTSGETVLVHCGAGRGRTGGVQMRGKKAANLQMVYLFFMLPANLIKFAVLLVVRLFQGLCFVGRAPCVAAVRGTEAGLDEELSSAQPVSSCNPR